MLDRGRPGFAAGLGMADGVLEVIPEAEVWHIGLKRDEHTLLPEQYYTRVPVQSRVDLAIVVDPMLATGGSAVHACELLKACGVPRLKFLAILAAPEGWPGSRPRCPTWTFTSARSTNALTTLASSIRGSAMPATGSLAPGTDLIMRAVDIIRKKREGHPLTVAEIDFWSPGSVIRSPTTNGQRSSWRSSGGGCPTTRPLPSPMR